MFILHVVFSEFYADFAGRNYLCQNDRSLFTFTPFNRLNHSYWEQNEYLNM